MHEIAQHDKPELQKILNYGCAELGLKFETDASAKILSYLALIEKWNRVHNLTAVRDVREMLTKHILDSLALVPFVRGPNVLDVGSGAGLPGIPLALALPQFNFTLLDSNKKKTAFLRQVCLELGLQNVTVVHETIEKFMTQVGTSRCFNTIVTRATFALKEFVKMAVPLCCEGGQLLAMQGTVRDAEFDTVRALPRVATVDVYPLKVPNLVAERHVVQIFIGK